VVYSFQTRNSKIKLLGEYESVTQKVLFGNAVLAALISRGKYDVIPQNDDCSRERMCILWLFETKTIIKTQRPYGTQYGKDPPSDNAVTFGDAYSVMKQRFTY
jgi:hypothetical protein